MDNRHLIILKWKGRIPFAESLSEQAQLKEHAKLNPPACVLGFECTPPCVTLGVRGEKDKDILVTQEQMENRGLSFFSIRRGGEATLHGPGQLVIYPIVNLRILNKKPRDFIKDLERITYRFLKHYGIETKSSGSHSGLFTQKGKIAFFGIHISEGISQHGLAINVKNDLELFHTIRSCGSTYQTHDRMSDHVGHHLPLKSLCEKWVYFATKHWA